MQKHLLLEHGLDPEIPDNRIIGAALGQAEYGPTTVLSNDAGLRIKAAHLGVGAAEHLPTRRRSNTIAAGWSTIETSYEAIDCLYAAGGLSVDAIEGWAASSDRLRACVG